MNNLIIFIILILLLCLFTKKDNIEKFNFCRKLSGDDIDDCKEKKIEFKNLKKLKKKLNKEKKKLKIKLNKLRNNSKTTTMDVLVDDIDNSDDKPKYKGIDNNYYTYIDNKLYNNHQLCLSTLDKNKVYRYTNYDKDWEEVIHKYIKKHPERFIREKNTNRIWDNNTYYTNTGEGKQCSNIPNHNHICNDNKKYFPRKLIVCGKKNGNIKNKYKDKIDLQKCIKSSSDNYWISKGINLNNEQWKENQICNRIYDFKDRGYYKYNDIDLQEKGGCTIYKDNKCQKIKKEIDQLTDISKLEQEKIIKKKNSSCVIPGTNKKKKSLNKECSSNDDCYSGFCTDFSGWGKKQCKINSNNILNEFNNILNEFNCNK